MTYNLTVEDNHTFFVNDEGVLTHNMNNVLKVCNFSTEVSEKLTNGRGNHDFTGKLRGEDVTLKNVKTKEITYVKRCLEERQALRKAFDSTERKNFLIKLSENEQLLKEAGLSEIDILDIKEGFVPEGWQIHHKLPLDDSGDNSFENLVLIKNEPYHKIITNYQNSIVRGLKEGEIKKIEFPIPEGSIYPLKNR